MKCQKKCRTEDFGSIFSKLIHETPILKTKENRMKKLKQDQFENVERLGSDPAVEVTIHRFKDFLMIKVIFTTC